MVDLPRFLRLYHHQHLLTAALEPGFPTEKQGNSLVVWIGFLLSGHGQSVPYWLGAFRLHLVPPIDPSFTYDSLAGKSLQIGRYRKDVANSTIANRACRRRDATELTSSRQTLRRTPRTTRRTSVRPSPVCVCSPTIWSILRSLDTSSPPCLQYRYGRQYDRLLQPFRCRLDPKGETVQDSTFWENSLAFPTDTGSSGDITILQ